MPILNPPVTVANKENEHRIDYIQNVSSLPEFEYPMVRLHVLHHLGTIVTEKLIGQLQGINVRCWLSYSIIDLPSFLQFKEQIVPFNVLLKYTQS